MSQRALEVSDERVHDVFSIYPAPDDDYGFDIESGFGDNARESCRELIKRAYTEVNLSTVASHSHPSHRLFFPPY